MTLETAKNVVDLAGGLIVIAGSVYGCFVWMRNKADLALAAKTAIQVSKQMNLVAAEVSPNGKKSMKDVLDNLQQTQAAQTKILETITPVLDALKSGQAIMKKEQAVIKLGLSMSNPEFQRVVRHAEEGDLATSRIHAELEKRGIPIPAILEKDEPPSL